MTIPKELYFIPIFLRKEALEIVKENLQYYDTNTKHGNIGCWLRDIAELKIEIIQKIKNFILYPDEMSKSFVEEQRLAKVQEPK